MGFMPEVHSSFTSVTACSSCWSTPGVAIISLVRLLPPARRCGFFSHRTPILWAHFCPAGGDGLLDRSGQVLRLHHGEAFFDALQPPRLPSSTAAASFLRVPIAGDLTTETLSQINDLRCFANRKRLKCSCP
jgi:hypothetical protein